MSNQKVLNIVLPKVESMMTGVWRILRAHDLVILEYTDGTRESACVTNDEWCEIKDFTFSIVGIVQNRARRKT